MSVKIKVLVDDREVALPEGVVKVIVEGLGPDEDHELHEAFTYEGVVRDVVRDGEIVDTSCGTYDELFDALFGNDDEDDEDDDDDDDDIEDDDIEDDDGEEAPNIHKHTVFLQVDLLVWAPDGTTDAQIDKAVTVHAVLVGADDPVLIHAVDQVARIDVVPNNPERNGH